MFSLQQLDDGGLRGGHQDDAAIFPATHQAALWRDVHARRHLYGFLWAWEHAQLVDDARWERSELIERLLQADSGGNLQLCR